MRKCTKNYKLIIFLACTKNIISSSTHFFGCQNKYFYEKYNFFGVQYNIFGVQYNFFGVFYFHCWFVCV